MSGGSPHPPGSTDPTLPPTTRLHLPPAGYLFALGPLLFVSICDVWLELFTRRQAYAINLVAVGVVAFGCTGMRDSSWHWGKHNPSDRGGDTAPSPRAVVSWDDLLLRSL